MIVTVAVALMLLLGLGSGLSLVAEGKYKLNRGVDGWPNLIAGVCISVIMLICGIALTVATFGG